MQGLKVFIFSVLVKLQTVQRDNVYISHDWNMSENKIRIKKPVYIQLLLLLVLEDEFG